MLTKRLSCLLCVIVAGLCAGAPVAYAHHDLTGRVCLHEQEELGLAGVEVELLEIGTSTLTGSNGEFSFRELQKGLYTLEVRAPGAPPVVERVSVPRRGPLRLEVHYSLEGVVVTGAQHSLAEQLGRAQTLSGSELAQQRGRSVSDAVSELKGARVLRSGSTSKPVVDGFAGSRVVIVQNGVRHHAQVWGSDHGPEVDPFSAGEIGLLRGAQGVRYGADALGGVLVLSPHAYPVDPGTSGELDLGGMTNGYQGFVNGQLASTTDGDAPLSFRAQGSLKRGGSGFAPDYVLDNTGLFEAGASAGVSYRRARTRLELSGNFYHGRLGLFTGAFSDSPSDFQEAIASDRPRDADRYRFDYAIERPYQDLIHALTKVELEHRFDAALALRLSYALQLDLRREYGVTRRAVTAPQVDLSLSSHTAELALEHRLAGGIEGVLGVTGLYQHNDHEGLRLIPDYTLGNLAAFVIEGLEGSLGRLEIGARYELQGAETVQPARIAPSKNPPLRDQVAFDAFLVSLGAKTHPVDWLVLETQLATATRMPTMNELFIDGPSQGQASLEVGDPSLRPERAVSLGLAAAFCRGFVDLEVGVHARYIQDFVYFAPRLGADGRPETRLTIAGAFPVFEYRNVDALYYGGDVELVLTPWDFLEWRSRGSLVRARNTQDDTYLVLIPPDRIEHRLSLTLGALGPLRDLAVWAESELTLRQTRFELGADFAPPPPAYHLMSLGLRGAFRVADQPVEASLELSNLFDTRYRDYLSRLRYYADEPGFSAILRIRVPLGGSRTGPKTEPSPPEDEHAF